MQGKWKENVSGWNNKDIFRKKTNFKHRVRDKKKILNRFNPYHENLYFYKPTKRIERLYKEPKYGQEVYIHSLTYNNIEYEFIYNNSWRTQYRFIDMKTKKYIYKLLNIGLYDFEYLIISGDIVIYKTDKVYLYNKIITEDINVNVHFLGKPLYDYIYHTMFRYHRKWCQKYANKTERKKMKTFLRKIKLDEEIYLEKFEEDFDYKKSINYCVS